MLKRFERVIFTRWFVNLCLVLPAFYLGGLIILGRTGANPVEFILLTTGDFVIKILLVLLWISPLRVILPRLVWLKKISGFKRQIGVACFLYGLAHFSIYLLDHISKPGVFVDQLIKPFTAAGFLALLILLPLALTSFNRAVKKLGYKNWKKLHRLVYFSAVLIFFHLLLKEKDVYIKATTHFLPLLLAEGYRFYHFRKNLIKL
ncbi:MAG: ferric reductase-like transmembrane domain-containing protein [Deltaproteobacteria bacterium]|nr:ferric reductase-like transmembrane domain-containing protein [Deltaproteobacteria bacterium]